MYLTYWKHLLRSRRRHGTHSPFVYQYADEVLRHFATFYFPLSVSKYQSIQLELLHRTLHFLQPITIENSLGNISSNDTIYSTNHNPHAVIGKHVILHHNHDTLNDDYDKIHIVIPKKPMKHLPDTTFNLTLNCFFIQIYINDNSFKNKQLFYLN